MPPSSYEWSREEVATLRALKAMCSRMRKLDRLMTVTNLETLIEVALQDAAKGGINVTDLAAEVETQQTNMSRIIRTMGEDERGRVSGLGLMTTTTNPLNYRERIVRLSTQGRSLVRSVCKHFHS